MTHNIRKLRRFFIASFLGLICASGAFAFNSGFHLNLRVDFGGGLTTPTISPEGLKALNSLAVGLHGTISTLLLGAEAEIGYIFRSEDFFGLSKDNAFSGVGAFFAIGLSQGSTGQKITAAQPAPSTDTFDIYMTVNFLPIVNFGALGKAYFFNNRFAVGLGIYGRMVADMNPSYLMYSSDGTIPTEVGNIIITNEMITKMNPFMGSVKLLLEYNIPVYKTIEVTLGGYMRYNIYKPKYITVPPSLISGLGEEELRNLQQPRPDYWLNSLDFGLSMAIGFKL